MLDRLTRVRLLTPPPVRWSLEPGRSRRNLRRGRGSRARIAAAAGLDRRRTPENTNCSSDRFGEEVRARGDSRRTDLPSLLVVAGASGLSIPSSFLGSASESPAEGCCFPAPACLFGPDGSTSRGLSQDSPMFDVDVPGARSPSAGRGESRRGTDVVVAESTRFGAVGPVHAAATCDSAGSPRRWSAPGSFARGPFLGLHRR